jgi:signal transduction histidine kinase
MSIKKMRCAVPLRTSHFVPRTYLQPTAQGIGLGLSLSYDIIKAHQGKIEIKNNPGIGAEFIITFPINARIIYITCIKHWQ